MNQTQPQAPSEFKEIGRQILRDQEQLDLDQYRERMHKFFAAYERSAANRLGAADDTPS